MKIAVFNCNSDQSKTVVDWAAEKLEQMLIKSGHEVEVLLLRDKNIKDCIGCFGCWVKTPGVCVHNDDMKDVLKRMLKTQVQIIVTDSRFGMVSPLVTSVVNRFLPLGCAYMHIDKQGKTAHWNRYDFNNRMALVVEDSGLDNNTALNDIGYFLHQNNMENYLGTYVIGKNEEEIVNALNSN
ncbi:MAG: flavodoxin family protein [Spirochaetes bacterium]|nr:flavodoxin family protein [Spirochaetota bacterium]MBN2772448.1 flavodoxin family protein [Spirochaetota bacterium]